MRSGPCSASISFWKCLPLFVLPNRCRRAVQLVLNPGQSNAIGATSFGWGFRVQHEANKFWAYSIFASLVLTVYQLLFVSSHPDPQPKETPRPSRTEKKDRITEDPKTKSVPNAPPIPPEKSVLMRQLVMDSCDILVPCSALGWVAAGPILMGSTMIVSTVLSGRLIWRRVQQKAIAA